MDYSKIPPGWQPPPGQNDSSRQLGFGNPEQYPMNPPPYSSQANPPPYQNPGDAAQYQPPYPQQGGFQQPPGAPYPPYPQEGSYPPPQPQAGFQNPYPSQPQNGFQNAYPTQPGYQNYQGQVGYPNQYPQPGGYQQQEEYQQDDRQYQAEDPKEKKKHKKFFYIIGGIVAVVIVACIIIGLSSKGSDTTDKKPIAVTKKPKVTEKPKLEPKSEKLTFENCTLVKNLTEFVNCTDLKNCRPMIQSNVTELPKEPEKAKNATTKPDIDLPQDILDSIVDIEFTDTKVDKKTNETTLNANSTETVDTQDSFSNQTVDLSHLANCSQIYYCNASLICADGNFTTNETQFISGTNRTIVYRRPGFSPIVPLIIPLPIPIGGSKIGKKIKPSVPISNPFKPSKGGFGGFKKG